MISLGQMFKDIEPLVQSAIQRTPSYGACTIKRGRRSKADMAAIRAAIYRIVEAQKPMSVRQVYYRLVCEGIIEKTDREYKGTVCRLLGEMRLAGNLPFAWITDESRWMRKPRTHSSLRDLFDNAAQTYRRSLWDDQDAHVEIWLEKMALAGVIYEETSVWDIPLMINKGYSSLTFLHGAAQEIQRIGKPTYLYYLGDDDPSGRDIARNTEERIRELAPGADVHFERIAVTKTQIEEWSLPSRPTKQSDSRAKGFKGPSVELDAIEPDKLRELVRTHIEKHVDYFKLNRIETIEQSEREILETMAAKYGGAG